MKFKLFTILFLCLGSFAQAQEYPIGQYYERKPKLAWGIYTNGGFYVSRNRIFLLLHRHNPDTVWSIKSFDHNDTLELLALDKQGELVNRLDTRMTDSMSDSRRFFPQEYLVGKKENDQVLLAYWRDKKLDSSGRMLLSPKIELFDGMLKKRTEWLVNYSLSGTMVHYSSQGTVTLMGCCSTVVQYNEGGKLLADSVKYDSFNSYAAELHGSGEFFYSYGSAGINVMDSLGRYLKRVFLNYPFYESPQARSFSTQSSDSALVFKFVAQDSVRSDKTFEALAKLSFDGQRKWVQVLDGTGPGRLNQLLDLEGMHSGWVAASVYSEDGNQLAIFDRDGNPTVIKRFAHRQASGFGNNRFIFFDKIEYDYQDSSLWVAGRVSNDQEQSFPHDSLQYSSVFILHLDQYGDPVEEEPNLIVEDVYSSVQQPAAALGCYPNPAQHALRIRLEGQEGAAPYQVFATTGQLMQQGTLAHSNAAINVAALAPGFYVIQVQSGQKNYYARFVKH